MYKKIKLGKLKTSKTEIIDIAKAWLTISLAFAFVFSGITLFSQNFSLTALFSYNFWLFFLVSLLTAGLGFLLHELGHKFVAQHYGCMAEFRAFDRMLYLAIGLALFLGFIFAAPGAVMISGMVTNRENGLISLAGPLINYGLSLIFLLLGSVFVSWDFVFSIGFRINFWLGLFNLIPFGNFDGLKILRWNRYVWSLMVAFGVYFVFFF